MDMVVGPAWVRRPWRDSPQVVAVNRAARGFNFSAPVVRVGLEGPSGFSGRLVQPMNLRPETGGEVRLAQQGDAALITVAGGGLPQIEARLGG